MIEDENTCHYQRSGRTDAEVNGCGQVISLVVRSKQKMGQQGKGEEKGEEKGGGEGEQDSLSTSSLSLEDEYDYSFILNKVLPPSIVVLGWSRVSDGFSARFSTTFLNIHITSHY